MEAIVPSESYLYLVVCFMSLLWQATRLQRWVVERGISNKFGIIWMEKSCLD
jgi:hypothetical protein